MAINSVSSMLNSKMRLSGLSSGLDTETMIQQLLKVERMKVDRVKQDKQLVEWKRDTYRDLINTIRGFRDEYFDILRPNTNMRSSSAYSSLSSISSNTDILTVTAGSSASADTFDVVVSSIAATAKKTSSSAVSSGSGGVTGSNAVTMSKMVQGKVFTIDLDGISKTITLDKDYSGYTVSAFATDSGDPTIATDGLQKLINDAFGTNKITVTGDNVSGKLTFAPVTSSSTITIGDSSNAYLGSLGLSNGQVNHIGSSEDITDFTGGNFKIQVDSSTAIDISVASATGRDDLVNNINAAIGTAFSAQGVTVSIKAIKDPDDPERIKFVSLDTTKKHTITAGDTDDMLAKAKIANGSAINTMNGTIDYTASDIGKDFYVKVTKEDGTQLSAYIDLRYDYISDASTGGDGKTLDQVIQDQLNAAGATDVIVNISGGKISFTNSNGHQIKMEKGDDGLRDEMGFTSTQSSNRVNLNDTLANLANAGTTSLGTALNLGTNSKLDFTINNVSFSFDNTKTLNEVINSINTSNAGVTVRYDSLTDKFSMESKATGASSAIEVSNGDADNFFTALNMTTTTERGTDASLTIDGTQVSRATNDFTVNGVAYKLKSTGTTTVTISANPDELVTKIKNFVTKYNEVIDKINGTLNEKKERDYLPLTDEQKEAMSDDDISKWEDKAKSGLLRNDSLLNRITGNMRTALYDNIYTDSADESSKLDTTLYSIGITTSGYYKDKGKLVVDETKLKEAIINNPDKVIQLFTKDDSGISYSDALDDSAKRTERYKESGLAVRLYDIIQDSIRTTRNANGQKGELIEKAGIEGDASEFGNLLYDEIERYNEKIDDLYDKLVNKENIYYAKFTAMERALSQMNSQGSWLSSQFGQGG